MRQRYLSLRFTALLMVFCGICGAASFALAEPPSEVWLAPPAAAERKNPIVPSAQSVAHGQALFSNCVICHGPLGHGDGAAAVALNPKPKDLTAAGTQGQSDGALFWKITQGRTPMPPWEQALSNEDRWDLVNYLRTISANKKVADQGGATSQPAVTGAPAEAPAPAVTQDDLEDIRSQLRNIGRQAHAALPGTEHLVIAGDGAITFTNLQKASSPSSFNAVVSPLFLWEPTDRILVTAAFDLAVGTDTTGNSSSSINVNIAEASVIINDYLIAGGGLFVVPFGQYHNHFDPPWIEKLPDAPLAFGDSAIGPSSEVGIFAHGAAPIRCLHAPFNSPKIVYDAYVANGPQLITNDPAAAGSLNFADFTDLNNGKAVGGRIGFLPFPALETGYSIQYSQAAPNNFPKTYVLLQAADLNWVQECRPLGGVITTRAEWIWSSVESNTYDPNGKLGFGPLNFSNYRNGGYVELAYRPTLFPDKIVRNLEFIGRWDYVRVPVQAPGGEHEQRYEFGVDYWLTPSVVLKVAYAIDRRKVAPSEDAFFVQLGFGL